MQEYPISDIIKALKLDALEGFTAREDMLRQAFLHPSYTMEHPEGCDRNPYLESNQRMEFLGDAILGFIAAYRLYQTNPECQEGELTKKRASLVREKSLAAAASFMGLDRYIRLGKGIAASGGAGQPSILADTFEALLGALLLCGATMPALEDFVFRVLEDSRQLTGEAEDEDYKGQLQAWIQKTNVQKLSYAILDEKGPDHRKAFLAAAYLDQDEIGRGWGSTKQEAQKAAAKIALQQLHEGQKTERASVD